MEAIRSITNQTRMLSMNAIIEAARAGESGLGFGVIAHELRSLADEAARLTVKMDSELLTAIDALRRIGGKMADEVRCQRLIDLALNAIEIMDRNLYERTCDVRWWATDAAIVDTLQNPTPERRRHAGQRLGIILDSYMIYLDLWLCDPAGHVIAHGCPKDYSTVLDAEGGQPAGLLTPSPAPARKASR